MIRVMLVDDEVYSLKGMRNMVPWDKWKCEVVAAVDGASKALKILDSRTIDIVFTDIKMPEMDGLQLIKEALKIQPDLVFVIISGYKEFDFARRAMQFGVQHYLLKPVGLSEIEEILMQLTEIFRPDDELGTEACRFAVDIDVDPFVKSILQAVAAKNWNIIGQILLDMFKELAVRGGSLEDSRRTAIRILSSLVKNELIFSNESTLMLAGKIGSAESQSTVYSILKEQILLTQNQGDGSIKRKMNSHIQKILIYLLTHYRDQNLTLKWLSEHLVFVNTDYLGKLFNQEIGKSFSQYLGEYRIVRACEILKNNPEISIQELAEKTGYCDNVSYFIRQFRKVRGMTPGEYAASTVVQDYS